MDNTQIKSKKSSNIAFFRLLIMLSIFVVAIAYYVAKIWFMDDRSYEVYKSLKLKKEKLQFEVKKILQENVKIQKDYLNLKNLEQ